MQFIVITKGAERVSEVAARFTLDAMPGKQMAIDADLSSGLIDETAARTRREKIQREADFYGAMDGATTVSYTHLGLLQALLTVPYSIPSVRLSGMMQHPATGIYLLPEQALSFYPVL